MRTTSANETRTLGERLASSLRPGDVLLLLGRGLGIQGPVASPTFTILQVYDEGHIPLYHFDWYRLESADELYEMGMDEYLGGDGIAIIEWPSQCPEAIPPCRLEITLTPLADTVREITWRGVGGFHEMPDDQ